MFNYIISKTRIEKLKFIHSYNSNSSDKFTVKFPKEYVLSNFCSINDCNRYVAQKKNKINIELQVYSKGINGYSR